MIKIDIFFERTISLLAFTMTMELINKISKWVVGCERLKSGSNWGIPWWKSANFNHIILTCKLSLTQGGDMWRTTRSWDTWQPLLRNNVMSWLETPSFPWIYITFIIPLKIHKVLKNTRQGSCINQYLLRERVSQSSEVQGQEKVCRVSVPRMLQILKTNAHKQVNAWSSPRSDDSETGENPTWLKEMESIFYKQILQALSSLWSNPNRAEYIRLWRKNNKHTWTCIHNDPDKFVKDILQKKVIKNFQRQKNRVATGYGWKGRTLDPKMSTVRCSQTLRRCIWDTRLQCWALWRFSGLKSMKNQRRNPSS